MWELTGGVGSDLQEQPASNETSSVSAGRSESVQIGGGKVFSCACKFWLSINRPRVTYELLDLGVERSNSTMARLFYSILFLAQ